LISIPVIPLLTTYGDIIKTICEKIKEPEPSHYYVALNYETEMPDDMVFESRLKEQRFQMIMRTKWLLEYIAERTIQKRRLNPEILHALDIDTSIEEGEFHQNSSILEI
jgi:hypothetical protein